MKFDVFLIDGRNLLYRAHDTHRNLSAKIKDKTVPTGGMYGFLALASRVSARYAAAGAIVVWEGDRSSNFRYALYSGYKKRRAATEDDAIFREEMEEQERRLRLVLKRAGVVQLGGVGCEADDVLGAIAVREAKRGKTVGIYSADSDLRQVVRKGVTVVAPGMRGKPDKLYGVAEVCERHDVLQPKRLVDLKALSGDSSDNIPGISGIGPKTAAALVRKYGRTRSIVEAAKSDKEGWPVAERFRQKLIDGAEDLALWRKLVKLDVKAKYAIVAGKHDRGALIGLLKKYKFRSLVAPAELAGLDAMRTTDAFE